MILGACVSISEDIKNQLRVNMGFKNKNENIKMKILTEVDFNLSKTFRFPNFQFIF